MANTKENIKKCIDVINKCFSQGNVIMNIKGSERTNMVNMIGRKFCGLEQMSSEDPKAFAVISKYLQKKYNENSKNMGLNESNLELPVSKNITRYDEDIVIKTVRDIIAKDFKDITVDKIIGEEGGALYNVVLAMTLEDGTKEDMESKRFYIAQTMSQFGGKFFTAVSAILPLVNINTSSYEFTKNSNSLRFEVSLCLSHTDDRDWVSGIYRGKDGKGKKRDEDDKYKEVTPFKMQEASASKKHAIKPIPLQNAVNMYNHNRISLEVLETALKACGRSELEMYVMRSVGARLPKVKKHLKSDSVIDKDDLNIGDDSVNEVLVMQEGVKLAAADFMVDDAFDAQDFLLKKGLQANPRTIDTIKVKWPAAKYTIADIESMINGRAIVDKQPIVADLHEGQYNFSSEDVKKTYGMAYSEALALFDEETEQADGPQDYDIKRVTKYMFYHVYDIMHKVNPENAIDYADQIVGEIIGPDYERPVSAYKLNN